MSTVTMPNMVDLFYDKLSTDSVLQGMQGLVEKIVDGRALASTGDVGSNVLHCWLS